MSGYHSHGVVRFSETDASGRFHYASALMWAENAEHELYRAVGIPIVGFPRRAVSATFERPLVDGAEYVVELHVEKLGSSSVTYGWRIHHGEDVAVTGSHTVVHLDESGRPTPLPEALRARLLALTTEGAGARVTRVHVSVRREWEPVGGGQISRRGVHRRRGTASAAPGHPNHVARRAA